MAKSVAPPPHAPQAHPATGPALAMLQLVDTPRGLRALDVVAKEAPIEIVATGTVQCGHYLLAFRGQSEAVVRSWERAMATLGDAVLDRVLLHDAEPRLVPAFREGVVRWPAPGDTLGVLQSSSCPTILGAVEAALKGAEVDLLELRLGDGLGGKALATLWGDVHDVEAAIELACAAIGRQIERGYVAADAATTMVIPNADDEVRAAVSGGTRFFKGWRG
jgi:microcompartment protein CcmL/EutN